MNRFASLLACGALLASCASVTPKDPAQGLYVAESGLVGAMQIATTYASLPRCGTGIVVCSDPATVTRIKAAASTASGLVLAAQQVITANGSAAQIAAAVAAAEAAVEALQTQTSSLKVS